MPRVPTLTPLAVGESDSGMTGRVAFGRLSSVAAMATLAISWRPGPALGGTTGKLAGTVLDAKKQPLAGVNVSLPEARLGAVSDAEGRFVIYNVPAGTYTLKAGLIGYATTSVTGVAIPADRTTTADVTLQESARPMQEIVVSARRPVVELGLTSNIATLTRDEISKLPVQELQDVVNLQAGVVDGHFRGGRKGEVQYARTASCACSAVSAGPSSSSTPCCAALAVEDFDAAGSRQARRRAVSARRDWVVRVRVEQLVGRLVYLRLRGGTCRPSTRQSSAVRPSFPDTSSSGRRRIFATRSSR